MTSLCHFYLIDLLYLDIIIFLMRFSPLFKPILTLRGIKHILCYFMFFCNKMLWRISHIVFMFMIATVIWVLAKTTRKLPKTACDAGIFDKIKVKTRNIMIKVKTKQNKYTVTSIKAHLWKTHSLFLRCVFLCISLIGAKWIVFVLKSKK